ncbi:MAG: hypothetical protein KC431_14745 [Myxococcales bacterium]|nr:hypothetical protein [Myxococcales bacterium]
MAVDSGIQSERDTLYGLFTNWAKQAEILDLIEDNVKMVVTWVDLCAPPGSSMESRKLACMDLCVVFFALDDYTGPDCEDLFARCHRILSGDLGAIGSPLTKAYAEVIHSLTMLGEDMSEYLQLRHALIERYSWRNQARKKSPPPTYAEYLECRRTTIYTRQWLGVWEILEHCMLTQQERSSAPIRTMLMDIVDWQIYENEIVSIQRDSVRGELNLVVLFMNEQHIDINAAAGQIEALQNQIGGRFEQALRELGTSADNTRLRRFQQILDRCYHGAIEINNVALGRYSRQR